jgi:spermidine synthase
LKEAIRTKEVALLFGTFLIAICGLVYELLAGTLSSYLLGDSIYHFSLVIGLFMSSMGVGAWLSRFVEKEIEKSFVIIQFSIAFLGGFSAFFLFYAFAYLENYSAFLYLITLLLGAMLGVEIPLIIRILKESFSLKTNISNVFTMDYIGALFASLLFPLVLVPQLGLMQTSFLFGGLNLMVGAMAWYLFRSKLGNRHLLTMSIIGGLLVLGFFQSNQLTSILENRLYQHKIIYTEQTPYQKILLTGKKGRIQLFINGALQFDSIDEYRYHESLIHPVMSMSLSHQEVLIIGGGDGLGLRELLKYNSVQRVTLVDLDPAITTLFAQHPTLSQLNHHAYDDPRVRVINQDAWKFIEQSQQRYDVIIVDLPDPNNLALSRLYSQSFYHALKEHLSKAGAMVTQATSPSFAPRAFWSIETTLQSTGLHTLPYHTYIPSFGEWGFVIASPLRLHARTIPPLPHLRYIDTETFRQMQHFPRDMAKPSNIQSNRLSDHRLIDYYLDDWKKWHE